VWQLAAGRVQGVAMDLEQPVAVSGIAPKGGGLRSVGRGDRWLGLATLALTVVAGVASRGGGVLGFATAAIALALLATCVGRAVDALGDRVSPAATGVLQSALGNLPELLILVFALRAGLLTVVQATLVGSILANVALILGLAFVFGGLRHGTQQFSGVAARTLGLNLLLAVAVLAVPSLTAHLHTPAAGHERTLSVLSAVVLLVAFGLSLVHTLKPGPQHPTATIAPPSGKATDTAAADPTPPAAHASAWPLWLAVVVLAVTGVLAALVSDWFVAALTPAMTALHISDAFAGLIIVAIAGNAVENVVGIQLAVKNRTEHALEVVLQSPVQIAMFVAPVVLLLAPALGAGTFTLVLPPLLLITLLLSAALAVFITLDGESTWYEGFALIAVYTVLGAAFWWG
jgi:Ca2+:H+ antiporter